jgi:hypothetical protein
VTMVSGTTSRSSRYARRQAGDTSSEQALHLGLGEFLA